MGQLTTHVLDTASGKPAAGMQIDLFRLGDRAIPLISLVTNADGRCDAPLLSGAAFTRGNYELVFHAGDYFASAGVMLPEPRFLDQVVIHFGVSDESQHYHVPLLISPFAYSTYRGS
jgi:5-hydroxyisourate hydrolase